MPDSSKNSDKKVLIRQNLFLVFRVEISFLLLVMLHLLLLHLVLLYTFGTSEFNPVAGYSASDHSACNLS